MSANFITSIKWLKDKITAYNELFGNKLVDLFHL